MAEHRGTVLAVHVLAQANPSPDSSQAARQSLAPRFPRLSTKVLAIQLQEVEGVQEGFRRLPTHKFRIGEKVQFLGGTAVQFATAVAYEVIQQLPESCGEYIPEKSLRAPNPPTYQ
jgi:hypothetical protein